MTTSRILATVAAVALTMGATLGLASPALASATVSPTVIETGFYASSSAYNPTATTVAVANFGSTYYVKDSSVDFIDVATNTVINVTDDAITDATALVWAPDGSKVYVLNYSGGITVIDAATHAVVDTLVSGSAPSNSGLAITPDGSYLLTGDYSSGAGAVVDISANTYESLLLLTDESVFNIFVSPDGTKAYFMTYYGAVDVIDLTDPLYAIVGTLQFDNMGYGGISSCMSFDGNTLFMADYNDGDPATIARLDLGTGTSTSTTAMISESIDCTMTPDGKNVLFGSYGKEDISTVYEFDATTLAAVTSYDIQPEDASDVLASSSLKCDVYVSNFYETTNILNFDCSLPDTGASQALVITLASVGGGLLILGIVAVILVRRRNAKSD